VVVPEALHWNWHLDTYCEELQTVAERVFRGAPKAYDIIFNVPPGSSKSSVISVLFPAWVWCRMPTARTIGGTYASNLSMDLGRRCRDVVLSDQYQAAFPHIRLREDQRGKSYFMNTAGGSVRRTTVGSAIIGEHAHFLVVDDPMDPSSARSAPEREAANTWMTETISQRKVDQAVTPMILVMQRLHENDCTGHLEATAKRSGNTTRTIRLPATRTGLVSPPQLRAKYGPTGLLDPIRLPPSVLREKQALGTYMYSGQYLQNPIPAGGAMFKTAAFPRRPPPPLVSPGAGGPWVYLCRYWDKAATEGGGARTAGVLFGVTGSYKEPQFWILNARVGQWATDEREGIIDECARLDPVGVVIGIEDEGGSSGKDIALQTVRRHHGRRIVMHKPSGDKVGRADPVSVQVNQGNVVLATYGDARDEWQATFVEELKYFPLGQYKDQVDALSGAFALWLRGRHRSGGF
jgi:predicted phage terminase large subunit-like protein